MNKKYILSKAAFASVLVAGLLVGALAMAQTTPSSTNTGTPASTIVSPANPQTPNGNQHQDNSNNGIGVARHTFGFGGRGTGMMPRNFSTYGGTVVHRSAGSAIWFTFMYSITMILIWVLLVEVIILLFKKIKNHDKKQ